MSCSVSRQTGPQHLMAIAPFRCGLLREVRLSDALVKPSALEERDRGIVEEAGCLEEARCGGPWGVEDVGLLADRRGKRPRTLSIRSPFLERAPPLRVSVRRLRVVDPCSSSFVRVSRSLRLWPLEILRTVCPLGAASYIFATGRLSSSVGSSHFGNGIPPVAVTGVGS